MELVTRLCPFSIHCPEGDGICCNWHAF